MKDKTGKPTRKREYEHTVWFLAKIGENVSYEGEMTVMAADNESAKLKVRRKLQNDCGATLVFHNKEDAGPQFISADQPGLQALAHA